MNGLDAQERNLTEQAQAAPMLKQTLRWAAINSGTGNLAGLQVVASELADAFSGLPGAVDLRRPDPVTIVAPDGTTQDVAHGSHLVLSVRPDAARRILLTGHMDTVFGQDHPFQQCAEREQGVLNGPGVADMKGGLAIMLAALTAFEKSTGASTLGYDVVINSDEETGSASSAALITGLARAKIAALTYEPAALPDGTFASSRPGSGNFTFIITGRSAHAGRNPEDGRNAIVAAADLALRLAALRSDGLSVNPARIDGGGPNNVVPDHAVLRVNMRPATTDLENRARNNTGRIVAEISATHDVGIHVHGGFGRPPKAFDGPTQRLFALVQACGADLGQALGWAPSGGVCDGNNIAATGIPVIDTMGARGGAIHSDKEYLIMDSLGERAALSALTIHRIARGEFAA